MNSFLALSWLSKMKNRARQFQEEEEVFSTSGNPEMRLTEMMATNVL
jgi:hypothetical protein